MKKTARLSVLCALGLPALVAFGLGFVAKPARADPPYLTPPFAAFTPVPTAWSFQSGTLVNSSPATELGKKRLYLPLMFESVSWMSGTYWKWQASLEAGGATPSATIVCTMYAVADHTPMDPSNTVYFDGSTRTVDLTIASTLGRAVYIDCFVPRGGWIGNVGWRYTPLK